MSATTDMSMGESGSLHQSFAQLYKSSHLGVVIAKEASVLDANDAFLNMIGYTREELQAGAIDWWQMTPPEYRQADLNGMQQLREFGACVPFEKEYILRDGSRLPFMVGAVTLTENPLTWAAYVVNLSAQKKSLAAERRSQELEARANLVNQLAHDLNNPLAGLTFLLHLIQAHPVASSSDELRKLFAEAAEQLDRVTRTVRQVLAASQSGA